MTHRPAAASAAQLAAEALFCSPLQPSWNSSHAEVRAAVAHQLRGRNASHRCLVKIAAAYGDDPLLAMARMRWCRAVTAAVYPAGPTSGEERP